MAKNDSARISVLKSFCRDREELGLLASELEDKLGRKFTAKTIGYTIIVNKWRKNQR